MSSINVLLQSDYFVQLIVLGSVILMGLLTYVFGYKSTASNIDEEILKVETKETKKQKIEKAKKAEVKDKKKPKASNTTTTAATPSEAKQELEKPTEKPAAKKAEPVKVPTPKPTPKANKNKNTKIEEVKPSVVVAAMPEEDGWTTVTDRKQNKAAVVAAETVKATKPVAPAVVAAETVKATKQVAPAVVAVEKKSTKIVEAVQQKDDDSWTTVTDKKQKKTSETKSESPSPVAESKKSKKPKKLAEIEASATKTPVTEAVIEVQNVEAKPVVVEEDSEWKTANPKAIKKKSKAAPVVEAAKSVEVKKPVAPVSAAVVPEVIPASPKSDKQPKQSKPVKEEETVHVPQAIQELIAAQLTSPNSVAAAIIEQFKNSSKNNNIVSENVEVKKVSTEAVVKKVVEEVKKTVPAAKVNKAAKSQILKTTNLTESMVLIESDGKSNSRTDSNPSSSESLQDLDVGDGWATITSKKKRTVRREV